MSIDQQKTSFEYGRKEKFTECSRFTWVDDPLTECSTYVIVYKILYSVYNNSVL